MATQPETTTALAPYEQEALTWPERAAAITVSDQGSYELAADLLNSAIKVIRKQVAEHHDPIIKAAHETHKLAVAAKKKFDEPLDQAERIIKGKLAVFIADQQRKQQEEQARLEAEERKRQEEERLKAAEQLEASGADKAAVDAVLDAPLPTPKPVVATPTFQKRSDVQMVTSYSAEVTDFPALVKAAAKNPALLGYLLPNQSALNSAARGMKETMNVPGVKLVKSQDVRGKAK